MAESIENRILHKSKKARWVSLFFAEDPLTLGTAKWERQLHPQYQQLFYSLAR
jgi:hypothetical protein